MKMNPKDILGPTILLVAVCLVTTALLVGTNSLTETKIAELNQKSADEAKMEVLPEADSFSTETVTIESGEVEYYPAANGAGYVFYTSYKGYGGPVGVMTGISSDGTVTGVKVVDCDETPGLGMKSQSDPSFVAQYTSFVPESGTYEVTKTGEANKINAISGATITSRAVTNSVNYALEAFQKVTGGAN